MSCFKKILSLNDDKDTLSLLIKAANEVKPLMERRKWQVDILKEFKPKDNKLLGLNVKNNNSISIMIRCRTADNQLYPYETIFHTLLHELTHIVCGSHDEAFYNLLSSLTKETQGHTLNPTSFRHVPHVQGSCSKDDLREKMASSAEKRLLSCAPQKLGSSDSSASSTGTNLSKIMTAKEAAAMAAIMRSMNAPL